MVLTMENRNVPWMCSGLSLLTSVGFLQPWTLSNAAHTHTLNGIDSLLIQNDLEPLHNSTTPESGSDISPHPDVETAASASLGEERLWLYV